MGRFSRAMLMSAGVASVALGTLGIFLPLLPTTPFLLLAAACFARSSPRLLLWLNENRLFGAYIRNYRAGLGIPLREKILTIAAIWITIGVTVVFFIDVLWLRLALVVTALGVTVHLLMMKTYRDPQRM